MTTEIEKHKQKSIEEITAEWVNYCKKRADYFRENVGAIKNIMGNAKESNQGEYAFMSWILPLYEDMVDKYEEQPKILEAIREGQRALDMIESILGIRMKDNKDLFRERAKELGDIYAEIRTQKERFE